MFLPNLFATLLLPVILALKYNDGKNLCKNIKSLIVVFVHRCIFRDKIKTISNDQQLSSLNYLSNYDFNYNYMRQPCQTFNHHCSRTIFYNENKHELNQTVPRISILKTLSLRQKKVSVPYISRHMVNILKKHDRCCHFMPDISSI